VVLIRSSPEPPASAAPGALPWPAAHRTRSSGGDGARAPVFFGQILIEEGVLQAEDLRCLIQHQQETAPEDRQPIGRMALQAGHLDEAHLLAILDRNVGRLYLGELLVMRGYLSLQDLTVAMAEQAKTGCLLGEALLRLGLISESALAEGLAEQSEVAFIPIQAIPPDPALTRWVNASFACLHGLVPITCRGRNLIVAVWQPRSLAATADIEQATGLQVSVVLTTRQEVEARLRDLYDPAALKPPAASAA
jgi:hypothetical protein